MWCWTFYFMTRQLIPAVWESGTRRHWMLIFFAASVFVQRLHRGQQPKSSWSTSSSHVTPRRQPIWQSWLTATAAGSQRGMGRNPALTTQICESQERTLTHSSCSLSKGSTHTHTVSGHVDAVTFFSPLISLSVLSSGMLMAMWIRVPCGPSPQSDPILWTSYRRATHTQTQR